MNSSPSDQDTSVAADLSKPATLVRALGAPIAMAVVVGSVIGSGIFLKPGNIAAEAGSFPLIISVWVFGGVLCVLGALCFAELATMLPHAGGLYVYLREAYGRPVAFLFGWCEFLFAKPASIGALGVAFVGSLALALGWKFSTPMQVVLAAVLIGGLAWVNILGVLWGGRLQFFITLIKAGFLGLVAVLPYLLMPFLSQTIEASNYASTVDPRQVTLASQIGVVLLAVMWAYNGWHGITPLAEEVREPQRNIPIALFGGIGLLILLYVSANIAYHGVLSMEELKTAGDNGAEHMLRKLLGPAGLTAMSAVIMCSTFGAINANLLEAPRVTFAMGRDGVFFRVLGNVHVNYRTPAAAILVTALMSIALVVAVAIAKETFAGTVVAATASQSQQTLSQLVILSLQKGSLFELLTNFVIFASSIFYMLGVLAVIVLRIKHPEWTRPYRTWGYPLVPALFLAIYTWFMIQVYLSKPLESRTGLLLIALGLPVYFAYRRWSAMRSVNEYDEGISKP